MNITFEIFANYHWFLLGFVNNFATSIMLFGSSLTDVTGKALGGGIATIGMIGTGAGQGYAAGKAAEAVARNPEVEGKIRNMMILGAAIAETSALYCLVISIIILFVL